MARLNSLARWFSSMRRRLPLRGRHIAHIVMVVGAIGLICCFPPPGLVAHWKAGALEGVGAQTHLGFNDVPPWFDKVWGSLPVCLRYRWRDSCAFVFLDRLQHVRMHGPAFGDENLRILHRTDGLLSLDVSGSRVTTEGLSQVLRSSGESLESLDVSDSQVDRGIVPALAGLQNLRQLNLASTGVGPADLQFLQHRGADVLELGPVEVRPEEMKSIWSLSLTDLTLHGCHLDDEHFVGLDGSHFAGSCQKVELIDSQISRNGVLALRKIGPLESLSLKGSHFDGVEFEELMRKRGEALKELNVSGTNLNPVAYYSIRHAKRLWELNLAGTPLTDMDCTTVLANMTVQERIRFLEKLDLSRTQAGDITAHFLATCECFPLLQIDLSNTRITDRGVLELVNGSIQITVLRLRNADISDAVLPAFKQSNSFCLDIRGTRITERGRNRLRDYGHELIEE